MIPLAPKVQTLEADDRHNTDLKNLDRLGDNSNHYASSRPDHAKVIQYHSDW